MSYKVNVTHSYPVWLPQTQTWMYNQVKQLQRLGIEAHVVCRRTENIDQFPVANIHSFKSEPLIYQIRYKGLRKLKFWPQYHYLREITRRVGAGIIHSHFGDIGWANLGAVRKLKIKHAVTFYGWDVNNLPVQYPVWKERYRQLFKEVDLILCEGSHMAHCIARLGCPEQKVKIQHLGVDVDNIPYQPRQWQPGEPLQVLIAASFREKKGIPYAIEALGIIALKAPIFLTIIGDVQRGDIKSQQEKNHILKTIEKCGLKNRTRLLGYLDHQSMLCEAYRHHLFLQPSVTAQDGDTEGGAPVTIIEMLASGMPVVATTHCDIPEVVGPAFTRFLAPERDIKKLVECIQYLLGEPDNWPKLAREGRMHIEKEYNLQRQTEHLIERYKSIL